MPKILNQNIAKRVDKNNAKNESFEKTKALQAVDTGTSCVGQVMLMVMITVMLMVMAAQIQWRRLNKCDHHMYALGQENCGHIFKYTLD